MKRILLSSLSLILLLSLSAFAQDAQHLTLMVTGQPGQIPILQMNGKSYVDIDALARLTNSSVSIKGNQVILTPLVRSRVRSRWITTLPHPPDSSSASPRHSMWMPRLRIPLDKPS